MNAEQSCAASFSFAPVESFLPTPQPNPSQVSYVRYRAISKTTDYI